MGTGKDLTQRRRARSSGQDPHLLFQRGSPSSHQHAICSRSFGSTGRERQPRAHPPAPTAAAAASSSWSLGARSSAQRSHSMTALGVPLLQTRFSYLQVCAVMCRLTTATWAAIHPVAFCWRGWNSMCPPQHRRHGSAAVGMARYLVPMAASTALVTGGAWARSPASSISGDGTRAGR